MKQNHYIPDKQHKLHQEILGEKWGAYVKTDIIEAWSLQPNKRGKIQLLLHLEDVLLTG